MDNNTPHRQKQGFPLRLFAMAFVISLLTTILSWWQTIQIHSRTDALLEKHMHFTEQIGRIMLYDEVLTMSARMTASTGDSSYEERYDQFDQKLTADINEIRALLPQAEIKQFVGETDDANIALVAMERQAFALVHQNKLQEATTLLNSNKYLELKKVYAHGMEKTIDALQRLMGEEVEQLHVQSLLSGVGSVVGILVLLAAWFFATGSARVWAEERKEAEDALQKAHDELEIRVKERTADIQRMNEMLQSEIFERNIAEARIQRLTQLYAALSECNQAIVRCAEEKDLFQQVCRIAVEFGGFKMAWVGMVEETGGMVKRVASFGEGTSYLDEVIISANPESPFGCGPTGTSIREGTPYWCDDFLNDSRTAPWHESAARFGWGASVSLPLERKGVVIGVFSLYSGKANAFDEEARQLLLEMAADLGFALDNFSHELERKRHEKRTGGLLELSAFGRTLDEKTLLQRGLDMVQRLTDSSIGFLHFVNREQNEIELVTWSSDTLEHYCHAVFDRHYPVSAAGIWADCIRLKKAVIINDYVALDEKKGLPVGHAHLERFISVPIFEDDLVRLIVGVGNADRDYDEHDVETVKLFGNDLYSIAQRKRDEASLAESEQRFRAVTESANDGIITSDSAGKIIDWNHASERMFGYSKEETKDRSIMQLVQHRFRELHQAGFANATESGTLSLIGKTVEAAGLRKDGSEFPLELSLAQCQTSNGQILTAIIRDITERKSAEAGLRKLGNAIDQSGEMILITDSEGRIQYANPAVCRNTGFTVEDMLGKTLDVHYSAKQDKAFYADLWSTVKSGANWHGNIHSRKKNGVIFEEEMTVSPVFNENNEITNFVVIGRDITHERKMQQQLLHAEKLSTVGTFVAGVAHELNNPLTSVIGFAELLMEKKDLPEDVRKKLRLIYEQSERTVGIVKNLLVFSRKGKKEKTTVNLNETIDQVLKLYQYRLKSDGIEVLFTPSIKLPIVFGIESELQQVFMNIVVNAHHAMQKVGKGTLTIRIQVEDSDVSVSVENNGPSIPSSILPQLFDPFFTTKETGEGTGLGLYICLQIVQEHQGKILAENLSEESGVRFTVILPFMDRRKPHQLVKQESVELPDEEMSILFIDDEESIRLYISELLTRKGNVSCLALGNAKEAIEVLQHSDFDIVISDVKLPELSGLEFGKWLLENKPEMAGRFILMTGLIDEETDLFAKQNQCVLIRKPLDKDDLFSAIASIMKRK